ncbi:MAG: competence/damage-inducible protein A [candidate division NC10 bacterium]|nr:competence/damage-inducible protein A [candidate division NC10 bacterium]
MIAEILTIGSELLLGRIVNTNVAAIAERLSLEGIQVAFATTVGDELGRIEEAFRLALARADLVIATGGLGPTEDDLTREAVSAVLGRPLKLDEGIVERIRQRFARRGVSMPKNNEKQALVPEGALVLENPHGTAPGLFIQVGERQAVLLTPGVPREMLPMLGERALPKLRELFGLRRRGTTRVLKVTGLSESKVDEMVGDLIRPDTNPAVTILAHPGEIHLVLRAIAEAGEELEALLGSVEGEVRRRLGVFLYGTDHERLEDVVGRLLTERRKTVAVAESCTGGLVAHRLTNVPGSSFYFERGVVAYSEEAKQTAVDVPSALIHRYGAVSREVAEAMAEGIRKGSETDYGLGITGIAGPSGGTPERPVGLVHIALSWGDGIASKESRFPFDREMNKWWAAQMALDLLRRHLLGVEL